MRRSAIVSILSFLLLVPLLLAPLHMTRATSQAAVRISFTQTSGHPRLWVRDTELSRLRGWASAANPLYANGLSVLAAAAKADMDANRVPAQDEGGITWDQYPTEMYAQLFAFMSLIENDPAVSDDYAQRAHTLLMYVVNEAAKGSDAGRAFRDPDFSTSDRSRWWGEGFALTVDWIYPSLSAQDKAAIRTVFLRWAEENRNAATTDYNHPVPQGLVNDPALLADTTRVRWSANNYYLAHMRNMGLMALALDPADDPGNALRTYLDEATGAWLYVVDHLLRDEARGGFSPEGWEYGPAALGYMAQFLLALHTAQADDPAQRGNQVDPETNPFWDEVLPAYLHSLSPATHMLADFDWLGPVYQPAWYGDGQDYWAPEVIGLFGPLGLLARSAGNTARVDAIRWLQTYTPPGGTAALSDRVASAEAFTNAILYFLLFDPNAPAATDPRAGMATSFYAPGTGRILARTGWDDNAAFFSYHLGWITIDHQLAEGNQFGFYRKGEWLTKGRVGWDGTNEACTVGRSDYHNNLALENDNVEAIEDWLRPCRQAGSQWLRDAAGDGQILAHSMADEYVYVLGDATDLYNNQELNATDIVHASRSIVWLKPDVIVVYDRATSQTSSRFKRFWLNLPGAPQIAGKQATATTPKGQRLFVTTLRPTNAQLSAQPMEINIGEANGEPMQHRLRVEAPGGPADVRFLHVLQGLDAGATALNPTVVESTAGAAYTGAVTGDTVLLFPRTVGTPVSSTSYQVPSSVAAHLITGLQPNGQYTVTSHTVGDMLEVTVSQGSGARADGGGVLVWPPAKEDSNPPAGEGSVYLPAIWSRSAGPATASGPVVAGCPLLPADNIWNTPVDSLTVHPNSDAYVATIGAERTLHPDFGSGTWEGAPIGIPFTTVPGDQPKVAVAFDYDDESDPGPYPVPENAPIEGVSTSDPDRDGDRHVLVVDRDNCVLYELFYAFPRDDGGWDAGAGARFDLTANDLRPETWTSADAAGLPILPGLVRYEEVAAGEIRHAIRFTAPQTQRAYVWPARHFASNLAEDRYPPMGLRFRLKAGYDITGFSPAVQTILTALKTYGMILADNGSAWFLSGAPDDRWDDELLRELKQVPGSAFEAVDVSSLMVEPDSGQAVLSGAN